MEFVSAYRNEARVSARGAFRQAKSATDGRLYLSRDSGNPLQIMAFLYAETATILDL
jgi:hypothetical protein